jgi:hypothetical protein
MEKILMYDDYGANTYIELCTFSIVYRSTKIDSNWLKHTIYIYVCIYIYIYTHTYIYIYARTYTHTHMCPDWWTSLLDWQILILSGEDDKELPAKKGPSPTATHVHGLHEIRSCKGCELLPPINTLKYMNFLTVQITCALVNIQIIYSHLLHWYIPI